MYTLPDDRHFWKSLVSSVRNCNTTRPVRQPPVLAPPRHRPGPPAKGETRADPTCSTPRPSGAAGTCSLSSNTIPVSARSDSVSRSRGKRLQPEVSSVMGGASALSCTSSANPCLAPVHAPPPTHARTHTDTRARVHAHTHTLTYPYTFSLSRMRNDIDILGPWTVMPCFTPGREGMRAKQRFDRNIQVTQESFASGSLFLK